MDTVVLDDIRGTADTGRRIIAMLGHFITRTCNHKTSRSRDVEGVLAVSTRSYHVDIAVCLQDGRDAGLKDSIAKAQELIDGDTSHLQTGEQGGNLFVGVLTVGDTNQNRFHLFTSQFLVVQHPIQDVFHCLCHIF